MQFLSRHESDLSSAFLVLCTSESTSVSEISSFSAGRFYAEYTGGSFSLSFPFIYFHLHSVTQIDLLLLWGSMRSVVQGQMRNKVISLVWLSHEVSKHCTVHIREKTLFTCIYTAEENTLSALRYRKSQRHWKAVCDILDVSLLCGRAQFITATLAFIL